MTTTRLGTGAAVGAVWDDRVAGFLGRVLDVDGAPVGTCFQVSPGVLVTAAHVLADVGCDGTGALLEIDALNGTAGAAPAEVVAIDASRDLAVVRRALPLEESVPVSTRPVDTNADVVVTGVCEVDDPGHGYQFLDAAGTWQGAALRDDEVKLWRITSSGVVRGMSGAPVLRLTDRTAVGVVSARYNSSDGWLRDSVWVARTDDLAALLVTVPGLDVRRRLVLADEVGTVLSVRTVGTTLVHGPLGTLATRVAPDGAPAPGRSPNEGVGGLHEAALEAERTLTALDDAYRGIGGAGDAAQWLLSRAAGHGNHDNETVRDVNRRTRLRGLDPRVLLLAHPEHEEALRRWAAPLDSPFPPPDPQPDSAGPCIPGTDRSDPVTLLTSLRRVLVDELSEELFAELSAACRRHLRAALTGGREPYLDTFLTTLTARLPKLRTGSSRGVLARRTGGPGEPPPTAGIGSAAGADVRAETRRIRLVSVAAQMCRLPDPDPVVTGRSTLVANVVRAIRTAISDDRGATAFLSGQPGVGTSTVAVAAARELAPHFPDGVFYVNLYGLVPEARRPARTAQRMVAEALDLDIGTDSRDDGALFAAFAAGLEGRRVLLVLDDALDAAHVAPLAKATARCAVIVTSRDRVQGYADHPLVFRVEPLTRAASVQVLASLDPQRHHDPARLREIAELCADVPLALRMIGARMGSRPDLPLDYLLQLLRQESTRLDYLDSGDRAVRTAIRLSYDNLDTDSQQAFRLVAAVPGAVTTGEELDACLAVPLRRQELYLNRLVDRSLAQHATFVRSATGVMLATFTLFDLVLLFAKERLEQEEPVEVVHDVQSRVIARLRDQLAGAAQGVSEAELSGVLDPARFHAAERLAEERGWFDEAAELALGLSSLYSARGELDAVVAANDVRIGLHLRLGRPAEAVQTCLENVTALRDAFEDRALESAIRAQRIAAEHGLKGCAAEVDFTVSLLLWKCGDLPGALAAGRRSVASLVALGHQATAVPVAINNCKLALRGTDMDEARSLGEQAGELAESHGTAPMRASALFERQRAEVWAGNHREAVDLARRAQAQYASLREWWNAAVICESGARAAQALDDLEMALEFSVLAVDHWTHDDELSRLLIALIDLSALEMALDRVESASQTLTRALRALDEAHGVTVPPALGSELRVRKMALNVLFNTDSAGASDGARLLDLYSDATLDEGVHPDVARVHQALHRYRTFGTGRRKAMETAHALLVTATRYLPEGQPMWLHEELGSEPMERPSLNAGSRMSLE
ncbi:NB-ARC domain-containing protein [Streptomyces sp. NPDC020965]|uniref:NB-ARC domain-containing protein n=1 Tax=Streptomyces sp. NPDC020965 TaxID=3365105 RepID=UPI0037AC19F4